MTSLDLSGNGLYYKTGAELAQAFAAIPAGVTSLDLRYNHLYNKTGAELAEAFGAIPAGVASLDLSDNGLDNKSGAELAQAFAAIPAGVTSLDLSGNYLYAKKGGELTEIFQAMPVNITSVLIDGRNINPHAYSVIAPLEEQVNNEIARLKTSKSNKGAFLVNIGVIEASDAKITALEGLKDILQRGAAAGKNQYEFHEELRQWKKDNETCIAKQRNCIHSFFSPNHKPAAAIAVEEIFAALNVSGNAPEISVSST